MFNSENIRLFLEIESTLRLLVRTRSISADANLLAELTEHCKDQFIDKVARDKEINPGFLRTWIKHRCLDYLRANKRVRLAMDDAPALRIVSEGPAFDSFDDAVETVCLDRLFQGVSPRHRTLYEDVHMWGHRYEYAAEKYGISANSVGKTLNRVKGQLRTNAQAFYPTRMAS